MPSDSIKVVHGKILEKLFAGAVIILVRFQRLGIKMSRYKTAAPFTGKSVGICKFDGMLLWQYDLTILQFEQK